MICVGRFAGDERDDAIIAAQTQACHQYDDFLILTDIAMHLNRDSVYMTPYVAGHYSAAGLERLGETAGRALEEWAAAQ